MRTEFFKATEAALYLYPDILRQIKERERYLEELIYTSSWAKERVSGGLSTTEQERALYMKENDMHLKMLQVQASYIQSAVETLPGDDLKQLTELYYFKRAPLYDILEALCVSERTISRMRRRIVEHCASFILGPFGQTLWG